MRIPRFFEVFCRGLLGLFAIWLLACKGQFSVAAPPSDTGAPPIIMHFAEGKPLPDVNARFAQTQGWIGGDGVYSIAMGRQRTLWLFGDTWVGEIRHGKRAGATMVNNTLAIQDGDGGRSRFKFFVARDPGNKPISFIIPDDRHGWFWPFDGLWVNGKLHLFLAQIESTGDGGAFGFREISRTLAIVEQTQGDPMDWRIVQKRIPYTLATAKRNIFFGAAVVLVDQYAYVYGVDEQPSVLGLDRHLVLARIPRNHIDDFSQWRFFQQGAWHREFRNATHLTSDMASEGSVTFLDAFKQYVLAYTERGMSTQIMVRTAAHPWGPWSAATRVYTCPDSAWDKNIFCYSAKAHPSLAVGDELVISYVANSTDIQQVAGDSRLYWPKFIRVAVSAKAN